MLSIYWTRSSTISCTINYREWKAMNLYNDTLKQKFNKSMDMCFLNQESSQIKSIWSVVEIRHQKFYRLLYKTTAGKPHVAHVTYIYP